MHPNITIKRGDAGKVISGQFLDANGDPVDLSGSTSRKVFMRKQGSTTNKIDGAAFELLDESTGTWRYTMTANDVDTAGHYNLEFEVRRPGIVDTFPTNPEDPYVTVLIQDTLE